MASPGSGKESRRQPAWRGLGWRGAGMALAVVALASVGQWLLPSELQASAPLVPFALAVVVAAALYGFAAGVVATAWGSLAVAFFFVEPGSQLPDRSMLLLFAAVGLVLSAVCEALRRGRWPGMPSREPARPAEAATVAPASRGASAPAGDDDAGRRKAMRDALLSRVLARLVEAPDPREMASEMFQTIAGEMSLDGYFNYDLEPDARTMRLASSAGIDTQAREEIARIAVGTSLCGRVAQTAEPLYVANVDRCDDPEAQFMRRQGFRVYYCAPLLIGGRLLGTLSFGSRTRARFDDEERAFLQSMAKYLAIAKDRAAAAEALRESDQRVRLALDTAKIGTWWFDPPSGQVGADARTAEIYCVPGDVPPTLLGTALFNSVVPADRPGVREAIARAMDPAGDGRFESQHQIQCTLGPRVRHVHALGQGFFEGEGRRRKAVRIVGTALDVTERVVAEREREALLASERRARLEAERAGRVRDEFLATLGHELRTPLNAVMGWTQVLRLKHGGDTALLEGLAVIERNARAQAQIIEDLLDMSRIVSGKVRIDVRPLELAEVVAAALETIRPAADAKRVALSFVRDDVPVRISGDPNRLQQVVWNLLSNAVKFTPAGGRVDVALRRVADAVELEVADTGRGMEAEFLPQLFQRFSQADSSTTRRFGGLGLGLAIVKQLVEMHGGTVRAESAGADRGATFTVTFAALDGPGAARPQGETAGDRRDDAAAPPRGELSGARVLVVEDDRDAREFTAHLLREWGAQVRTASSAGEAIAALRRELPDLVISDIGMPGEDGYVLMRTIRQWPAGQGGRLPAIALTAYARAEDRTQALQAGYDFHLPKPVEPSELLAACSALLARSGRQAAAVQ